MAIQQTQTGPGPVTLEDVRQALGETAPHSTNAGKLRAILGRGGMGTVQKHLDALRAERAAALMPQESALMPAAPGEAIAAIWAAAYGIAEARVRRRLDAVTAERDGLAVLVPALQGDVVALSSAADQAGIAADEAVENARANYVYAGEVEEQLKALQAALQEAQERHAAELAQERAQAASAALLAASEHARALAQVEHDRAVEREALQTALSAAGQRHADALALLHALRPGPAAAGA